MTPETAGLVSLPVYEHGHLWRVVAFRYAFGELSRVWWEGKRGPRLSRW